MLICSWNFIPSELNLLMALFPEEAPADLSHILQRVGIDMTLSIFREIGAKMDVFAHPEEVHLYCFQKKKIPFTFLKQSPFSNLLLKFFSGNELDVCKIELHINAYVDLKQGNKTEN